MSICRLCAACDSDLTSIFTRKQMRTIADMVQEVTSVEVPIDDPHSVLVCPDCIETTLVAFNFIKRVQEVDRQFEDKLNRMEKEDAGLVDVKQDVETIESSIFDADGVELIDHSASTMPTQNLLTLGDGSVEIVDGEPDETAKELLHLFVESIQHSDSDKWYKLKCDRDFAELLTGSLNNHKRVHITERKFVCDICGGKFKSNAELRLHNKSHEEPQLMCSSCGARFRKRSHLQVHLKVHDANAYEFTCHICQKQFKHKFTLKEHLTIHTGERVLKYACPHCSKKFPRNRDLQTHLRKVCEKD
ncbi:hypothetical protein quinque_009400 [Culex quinquefasciatus]